MVFTIYLQPDDVVRLLSALELSGYARLAVHVRDQIVEQQQKASEDEEQRDE